MLVSLSFFGHLGKGCAARTTAVTKRNFQAEGKGGKTRSQREETLPNKEAEQRQKKIKDAVLTQETLTKHSCQALSFLSFSPNHEHGYKTCMFTSTARSLEGFSQQSQENLTYKQRTKKPETLTNLVSDHLRIFLFTHPFIHFSNSVLHKLRGEPYFYSIDSSAGIPVEPCLQPVILKATAQAGYSPFLLACMDICSNRMSHRGLF